MQDKLKTELREFLGHLVEVGAAASLPHFRSGIAIENKVAGGFDPVTAADRETEDALRSCIAEHYPDHGIIGEERSASNPDATYHWVIDPIDGTRAYMCGLPTWATLIGVCDASGPVLGLMSQPVVGEYFIAGGGAAECVGRSGRSLLVTSSCATLAQASVFATSPDMFSPTQELPRFEALSARARLTRFGVDSYAYCMLAAGHIDIVAEAGLQYHDIAALIPIVKGAGGVITDWHGAPLSGGGQVLAAANPVLHAAALTALAQ